MQCQRQLSPAVSQRTFSQTSMDSTGSGHMDAEVAKTTTEGEGKFGKGDLESSDPQETQSNGKLDGYLPDFENSDPQGAQSNGHGEVGNGEREEGSCDSHSASPDSGHVMSPDPGIPQTPPPDAQNEQPKKRERSHSTEITSSTFQALELNGDGSPNSSDEVFDASSPASSSQESGEIPSQRITPTNRERAQTAKIVRRKTVPAKLNRNRPISTMTGSSSTRTSVISHAPSYGTSRKGYTNVAGTPQITLSAVPIGNHFSCRRGSMAIPQKKKVPLAGAASPLHSSMPKVRVLKIVLTGNDLLVCHTAKAYAYLMAEEPNLFVGLDVRFYHVPLSVASSADWQFPERNQNSAGDTSEVILEQLNNCGLDVNIGRYMAHLDSWYERNIALAVHHTLRLLPSVSSFSSLHTSCIRKLLQVNCAFYKCIRTCTYILVSFPDSVCGGMCACVHQVWE